MASKKTDEIYNEIEQLHRSIRVGKKDGPIIDDLFKFIKDIIPLMLEVNALMQESSSSLPSASANLNNVSKTTELATNQVLDQLDIINEKLNRLRSEMEEEENDSRIMLIDEVLKETGDIVYAFQFQDITTQKLEHVNHILQAIYEKFYSLFRSALKIKDSTLFGNGLVKILEEEQRENKKRKIKTDFDILTEDEVRQTNISQEQIDHYFRSHK